VVNACVAAHSRPDAAAPATFLKACVDYLVFVLAEFDERDQRLLELARVPSGTYGPESIEQALSLPGRGRDALALLEAAVAASDVVPARWRAFGDYFNEVWSARRARIDSELARRTRSADWRAMSGIDADSILEERRRYAAVRAALPPTVRLGPAAAADT
jgi:hypothetical protein